MQTTTRPPSATSAAPTCRPPHTSRRKQPRSSPRCSSPVRLKQAAWPSQGVSGFLFFIFPAGVLAIVFGHVASSQIRKSNGRFKGAGIALAGLILGYAGIALVIVILLIAAF